MLATISSEYNTDKEMTEYHWELHDGPDGIDKYNGKCKTLVERCQQILEHREINKLGYL